MFTKIMTPVDLAHADKMDKALRVARDTAIEHGAELCLVGVTSSSPGKIAHTPEEYGQKLKAFAATQADQLGVPVTTHVIVSHDPSVQMDRELEAAVKHLNADLVVMATHLPNVADYLFTGHGAHMAAHSAASVFLVR